MTLRRRLGILYAGIVVACVLMLFGLIHHEFVVEPKMHCPSCPGPPKGFWWAEVAEVFCYAMIPLVLGCGWWLMRRSLEPIVAFTRRIEHIQASNLRTKLPITGESDEVDRLAEVFNAMTARLDQSFRQIQDFALHASHELKTPLTVMRAELETVLRDSPSLERGRREWIHGMLDEVQRLTKIVDAMTLLAKADSGSANLTLRPVRFGDLVRESYEDALILAEPSRIQVELGECESLAVMGDPHRLRQLLLNLTDNAIKYNITGGRVTISLRADGGDARLVVANTGPGVPEEVASRVFEQFVRGDDARRRGVEGSGLGLAIARWIVQAHGGAIHFASAPDAETVLVVRIPMAGVR